jgi:hypothetical protein
MTDKAFQSCFKQYPVFICRATFLQSWWPRRHVTNIEVFFCTVCSDCMLLLLSLPESTTWSLLGRLYPLLSSRLLWWRRCPPRGWVELLSLCCNVVCGFSRGIDGTKRQSMTSVGEVTAEEGRGRKCFYCAPSRESSRRTLAYETSMVPQDHCQRTRHCMHWSNF